MKLPGIILLTILVSHHASAQKLTLDKFSKQKVDSLKRAGADAILWYKSYCGECFIERDKNHRDTLPYNRYCTVNEQGYTIADNIILYRQKNKYFSLSFDCTYPAEKKQLDTCRSIPYFISILQVLNNRDKAIKAIFKKSKFLPPLQSDGGFEDAVLYYRHASQKASMSSEINHGSMYSAWKRFFWIDKEIKLMSLISKDISIKK